MISAWNDSTNPNVIIDRNEITESFKKHFFNDELKEEAVGDLVAEIIFRKLVEQTNIPCDQTGKSPTPELPAEKPSQTDIKKDKYIA